MSNKRYYWLKLDENFFEDDTIKYLLEQKNGAEYVIFYLKLCCASLKDEGTLIRYVGNKLIPYDAASLSKLTDTNIDTVTNAMSFFVEFGLISEMANGEIFMEQLEEMIGSETDSAKRMRKLRAREKALALSDSDYEVIDEDEQESHSEVTDRNNGVTNDEQCDWELSQSDFKLSHSDEDSEQSDKSVHKSDTDIDNRDRYRDRVRYRERHNRKMSQNDVPQLGLTNSDLVHNYFYSDIKANSDKSDSKYVYKAIDKYGWEEVLVMMIKLKEDQGAIINTFKYVETALERNHENYLKNRSDNEWMASQRMDRLRTEQVRGLVESSRG